MSDFVIPRLTERRESAPIGADVALIGPTAEFSYAAAGTNTRQFTDLSTDPDGTIVSWEWDFGDLGTPPTPRFTVVLNEFTATFTDQSVPATGRTITAWAWSFGDGGTATTKNPVHVYAAAGSYNVTLRVTDSTGVVSTVAAQQVVFIGGVSGTGRGYGLFDFWASDTSPQPNTDPFNMSLHGNSPGQIIDRINAARSLGHHLVLVMTGGSHDRYITNSHFDIAKWKAKMDTFNTSAIKEAVRLAVLDRTALGASMMDEPNHVSWGPSGYVTKAMMDDMADYVHGIFPTLPAGFVGRYDWHASTALTRVDFQIIQYSWRKPEDDPGNYVLFRDRSIASGIFNSNLRVVFSLNILDGGFRRLGNVAGSSIYDNCPIPLTGGKGTTWVNPGDNCAMTPAQLVLYGKYFGAQGAGLLMWRYGAEYVGRSTNQDAFDEVSAYMATFNQPNWKTK